MSQCFRYSIDFGSYVNPTPVLEQFRDDLRTFLASMNCDLFSNGLMNSVARSTGVVSREDSTIGQSDRQRFADWIACQNIQCTVTLGHLENYDDLELLSDFASDEIIVENLTPEQLATATEKRNEIQARIDAIQRNGRTTWFLR